MKAQEILAQAYEREVRQRIGDGLREIYDPTFREQLPSDWLKLLDSLRKRVSRRKAASS